MTKNWKYYLYPALLVSALPCQALAAGFEQERGAVIGFDPSEILGGDAAFSGSLPAKGRYVLVDAREARLFMVEDGRVSDSMRVIVGKPNSATPTMRSTLQTATLNPYWNVPTDLAQTIIAPRVVKQGSAYLRKNHYKIVSGFTPDATEVSPELIDWPAVAAGRSIIYVRQLPGRSNSMGKIKFGFTGSDGIFLHDTPDKKLFASSNRNLSNGCVRLEDAPRLARWLFGTAPATASVEPEQTISMPAAVPIVITYSKPSKPIELASR